MTEKPGRNADATVHSEIVATDEKRVAAILSGSKAALDNAFSNELVYVHSSGKEETKEQYVDQTVRRVYDYRSFAVTRRAFCVLGDLVLENGDADIDIVVNGDLRQIASRYLTVWKKEGVDWRVFRFHASSIARATLP